MRRITDEEACPRHVRCPVCSSCVMFNACTAIEFKKAYMKKKEEAMLSQKEHKFISPFEEGTDD